MNLSANRIAIYVTALAGLVTALLPVVTDLGLTEVAGILGGLLAVTAVVSKFLDGWQQYEGAIYQQQLIQAQHIARQEQQQAAVEAAQQVSGPRGKSINLPR